MAPMARPVMMPPPTIHGVRLPKRERVMSDSVPKMMFASNATIAPIELTKPSMASLLELSISSNTRGRMTVLSATHGIAQATAETVKPMPKRTSSALVGRWPSAETIGSRMSMNADASSGTAVSTAASAAMPEPTACESVASLVPCTCSSPTLLSAARFFGIGAVRREMFSLSSWLNTLSKSGRSSMPGRM